MKYILIDCKRQRFNAEVGFSIAFPKSILLFLFLAYNMLTAQVAIDSTKYYDHARSGSVKAITNKEVCAIIVFVSGPYAEWSVKKKHKLLMKDREAFKKLKRELRKFDVDFKLHIEAFNLDKDFEVNPADNQANAEKIWHAYTSSEVPFFKEKRYRLYEGGYFLIMHHQGMGNSLAAPDYLHGKRGSGDLPEYCTIFEYNQNRRKNRKYVTVHETLHLFGAWDLYDSYTFGLGKNREKTEGFPKKSVMRDSQKLFIDPITAWRIGLNNEPKDWFFDIIPQVYHKSFN